MRSLELIVINRANQVDIAIVPSSSADFSLRGAHGVTFIGGRSGAVDS
jgi:hypothetical protein